jgi:hypothetical protein
MSDVRIISVFNNKGGVGKTTLTFHLGHALAAMGKRTLFVDLDPQCNLTIHALQMEAIGKMWTVEDPFIDRGFDETKSGMTQTEFQTVISEPRSVHFTLQPASEGTGELGAPTSTDSPCHRSGSSPGPAFASHV